MKTRNVTSILILGIFFLFQCEFPETPVFPKCLPSASFTVDFNTIEVGGTVQFSNQSNDATTFRWDFGDGEVSTEENPAHTYMQEGNYEVILTAFCGNEEKEAKVSVVVTKQSEANTFTDPRDGKTYNTIWIDEEGGHDESKPGNLWLAENLSFDAGANTFCYGENEQNCTEYGMLYSSWVVENVIPPGWRLPTNQEWSTLFKLYGFSEQLLSIGADFGGNMDLLLEGGHSGLNFQFGGAYYNTNPPQGSTAKYEYIDIESATGLWVKLEEEVPSNRLLLMDVRLHNSGALISRQADPNAKYYIRCIKG